MFTAEQKAAVLDYYFAVPGRLVAEVVSRFGYPTTRTLSYWILADPRGKAQPREHVRKPVVYSYKQKSKVVEYAFAHPEMSLEEVVVKFGYPSATALAKWIREDGRERVARKDRTFFTSDQKRAVCEYAVSHPELPRKEVCTLFGYPSSACTLNVWCVELYGDDGRPQGPYSKEEKARALELCFNQPDKPLKEIARGFGFPVPFHVLSPLIRDDPRWETDPRNPKVKHALRQAIVECYFEDVRLRIVDVAEAFDNKYSPAGVKKLVMKDPRFGCPSFYGFTDEQRDAVLSTSLSNPSFKRHEIEKEVGFRFSSRVYYEWRATDPRIAMRPKRPRFRPISFAEKYECVSLVAKSGASRDEAAARFKVSRCTVTNWLRSYRRKGLVSLVTKRDMPPNRRTDIPLPDKASADFTEQDIEALRERNRELEFENDVLRAIFDVLKKEPGLSEDSLSNREKTLIINSLRPKYRLNELLVRFGMAKSSYEYAARALERPEKYGWLRTVIRDAYNDSGHAYGYRRIWGSIRRPVSEGGLGVKVSEKVVRRIMREGGLVTLPAMRLKRYNSYRGTVGDVAPNILKRDFHADGPHEKLLTDITEFHLNGFKMYLSPLIDCYNGEVVAYAISTRPKMNLVMKMLDLAMKEISSDEKPVVHSDQGFHYQNHVYVRALKDAGWTQSMSRRGCCSDNSACEGFFGRLKNEFFYNHEFNGFSPDEFAAALRDWIAWYNNRRVKESLGYLSPVEYRLENAKAA